MIEHMATRMNMLKLLQEVRGFAQFTNRPNEQRPAGPLLLEFRGPVFRRRAAKRKRTIKVTMLEQPDIPHPVQITYLGQNP
jgi:hypothetical protein